MSIYIYIYLYKFLYLDLEKRTERSPVLFEKERNVLTYFSIHLKRTDRSFRSFPFFAKERYVLSVLFRSLEKNGKERNVLLGPISRQKLEKRTEKNVTFFF